MISIKVLEIVKSCFDSTEHDAKHFIDYLLSEHDRYSIKKMPLLVGDEEPLLKFLQNSFENSDKFPSENLILKEFPELPKTTFHNIAAIHIEDFRVYTGNFIRERLNYNASISLKKLPSIVEKRGITNHVQERWDDLKNIVGKYRTPTITLRQYSQENYNERLKRPLGMATGIQRIDDLISGMDEGTVSVIAGFTSHMKTLFAMNIAYYNSYHCGYNIAYFSLETVKSMMYDQLLSRHSYDIKFSQSQYIPHDRIRKCELTQQEQDYLFNEIEPDLYADYIDNEGRTKKRGCTIFFDTSDFQTFSFEEISNTLEALDDKLDGNLDAVIVDYVQLCKFVDGGTQLGDDNRIINSYVAFFRKLAQSFRSGSQKKKLIVLLLSQINRDSWKRASKKEGVYDLTCLADANELERGASRVITTYTSENMKTIQEAQVQLLKNRHGATLSAPEKVFALPEAYVYGDEFDSLGQSFSGSASQSGMIDALSDLDF
jgi:replicative DNA helicase